MIRASPHPVIRPPKDLPHPTRKVRVRLAAILPALLLLTLPSCGLVRAPFRIVGSVAGGTYRAGTDLVDSTRTAREERRQRREAEEKRAEAKAERDAAALARSNSSATPGNIVDPIDPGVLPLPIDPLPGEIEGSNPDFLPDLPPLLPPD